MPAVLSMEERFWAKVDRRSDNECWEWLASKTGKGYGRISVGHSRAETATRVVWKMLYGGIPQGLHVLHRCDNPGCVNPSHLFLGTNADNIADMISKGRRRNGYGIDRNALGQFAEKPPSPHPRSMRPPPCPAKPDPEKFCPNCGVQFFRKRFNGRLEDYTGFSKRRFCSAQCGDAARQPVLSLEDRLWPKIDRRGDDDCWNWTGSRTGFGYGRFSVNGAPKTATRVIWELFNGPIPPGMLIMHKCDNPSCCNPKHLSTGTHAENSADKCAKGRQRHGSNPVQDVITGRFTSKR